MILNYQKNSNLKSFVAFHYGKSLGRSVLGGEKVFYDDREIIAKAWNQIKQGKREFPYMRERQFILIDCQFNAKTV